MKNTRNILLNFFGFVLFYNYMLKMGVDIFKTPPGFFEIWFSRPCSQAIVDEIEIEDVD